MLTGLVLLGLVVVAVFWRPQRGLPAAGSVALEMGESPQTNGPVGAVAGRMSFRAAFRPGFIFIYTPIVPVVVPALGVIDGFETDLLYKAIFAAALGFPLSAAGGFLMTRTFKPVVDETGLTGYSVCCFQRSFRWADIEVVGPIRIWTLRYLRLRSISS